MVDRYFVTVHDERGNRLQHQAQFENEGDAEALLDRVVASGFKIDAGRWFDARPVYGSEAYIEGRWEDDLIAWEDDQDRIYG